MITYETSTKNISFIAGFDSTTSKTRIKKKKMGIKIQFMFTKANQKRGTRQLKLNNNIFFLNKKKMFHVLKQWKLYGHRTRKPAGFVCCPWFSFLISFIIILKFKTAEMIKCVCALFYWPSSFKKKKIKTDND